jgi:hypothetical protein
MKGLRLMFIRLVHFNMLALSAISLLIIGGCMREPSRIAVISFDADAAGTEALNMYDTNKDGKISGAELDKVPSLRDSVANFNSTKEKGLTAADITARLKKWQDLKVGRMGSVSCTVMRNGKPLAQAEVKFVPEKFLGESLPISTGTSGPDGVASISLPVSGPDDAPGVPPGFYKVQITKSGENIPAKYNTQTILGAEVAPDARPSPLNFDLK